MTSVILHGQLGRKFGEKHKFLIRKPADAIKALIANKKGFYKAYKTWGREGKVYQVICDGKAVEYNEEMLSNREIDEIHICPVIIGAGGDSGPSLVQIALGVALIFVGAAFEGLSFLIGAGIGIAIGGVMSLLFPPPTPTFESSVQSKSFLFSSTENSTVQGVPVPVGYGKLRVGSKVISTSLSPTRVRGFVGSGGSDTAFGFGAPILPGVYATDVGIDAEYYTASNNILPGWDSSTDSIDGGGNGSVDGSSGSGG